MLEVTAMFNVPSRCMEVMIVLFVLLECTYLKWYS